MQKSGFKRLASVCVCVCLLLAQFKKQIYWRKTQFGIPNWHPKGMLL